MTHTGRLCASKRGAWIDRPLDNITAGRFSFSLFGDNFRGLGISNERPYTHTRTKIQNKSVLIYSLWYYLKAYASKSKV